jgi:cytochrome c oxidase subunit 1
MPESVEDTVSTKEERDALGIQELAAAGVSGLVGMAAMAPLLVAAFLVGVLDPSSFAVLVELFGMDAATFSSALIIGIVLFVLLGSTMVPWLFITLAVFLPGGEIAWRGVVFATIVWSGFIIAFYSGQEGLALVGYLALTLLAHWAYGYATGGVYDRIADIRRYEV